AGGERRRLEAVDGLEVGDDPDRPERDQPHLDALHCQRVAEELAAEGRDPVVQLADGRALHRARGVEQEQAGAARLGVVDKLGADKGVFLVEAILKGDLVRSVGHFASMTSGSDATVGPRRAGGKEEFRERAGDGSKGSPEALCLGPALWGSLDWS